MVDLVDQLFTIHQVAEKYWNQDESQIITFLDSIKVTKRTGGKAAGYLPAFQNYPSTFFKVYFYDLGFRFETAGLQAATAMPPVEGVRVPSVIAIMPEYRAILMEKRTWEDTSSPWKRLWVNRLGIDWFKVGAWLRTFHETQTTYQKNDYFLRKKYEKFESHLNDLKHLFTPEQVDKMNRIYQSAREYFEKNQCEWVISHGDFGLDNIKKSGSTLEIIDFEDCQPAPREFDVINCLTRLDFLDRLPRGRHHKQQILKEFQKGYGLLGLNSDGSRFLFLLIKLDMLETFFRRGNDVSFGRARTAVFHWFQREYLSQITRSLVTERYSEFSQQELF